MDEDAIIQQEHPNPIGAVQSSILQEERVNNFISQTSPISSLERINYILQGYSYSNEEKEWIKLSEGIPDKMRNDIIQFLSPDLSEDTRMTNLELEQINGIVETAIDFMKLYLYNAPKEMEITELDKIFWIVIKAVFITITRSRAGIERRELYKSLKLGGNLDVHQEEGGKDWWKFWS